MVLTGGIVISMESLEEAEVYVESEKQPCYADVSGGELWIKLLRETLKYGLTPKSWTDYLNLTVGGTLSNAGISGEAFKHGPQIHTSNVLQLQVVTGIIYLSFYFYYYLLILSPTPSIREDHIFIIYVIIYDITVFSQKIMTFIMLQYLIYLRASVLTISLNFYG